MFTLVLILDSIGYMVTVVTVTKVLIKSTGLR
jgi:hypothetical protein